MKDLAHHLKKLNRRIVRSAHREEMEEEAFTEGPSPFAKKQTVRELKKQVKRAVRKVRAKRTPTPKTPEERNQEMRHRVPVFDRINNSKPKRGARTTKKKTPRI